jgi:hypothetical protein
MNSQILQQLSDNKLASANGLAKILNVSHKKIKTILSEMVENGTVITHLQPNGKYKYSIGAKQIDDPSCENKYDSAADSAIDSAADSAIDSAADSDCASASDEIDYQTIESIIDTKKELLEKKYNQIITLLKENICSAEDAIKYNDTKQKLDKITNKIKITEDQLKDCSEDDLPNLFKICKEMVAEQRGYKELIANMIDPVLAKKKEIKLSGYKQEIERKIQTLGILQYAFTDVELELDNLDNPSGHEQEPSDVKLILYTSIQ